MKVNTGKNKYIIINHRTPIQIRVNLQETINSINNNIRISKSDNNKEWEDGARNSKHN